MHVASREGVAPTFEDLREMLDASLRPRYNEYRLLQRLHERAEVAIDSVLFDELMYLEEGP